MLECVAGKGRVINLDVDLEVLVKTVSLEETDNGLGVNVILVLGRLHGLGLDKERAGEALGAGVVTGGSQHTCKVVLLTLHLGVQQAHVALAAAPENVVAAAKLDRGVDGGLDLNASTRHDVEVGVRSGAVHVALVAENVGCAPKKLDAGLAHTLKRVVRDGRHTRLVLGDCRALVHKVYVVEAEILDTKLTHYLEAGVKLVLGTLQGVVGLVPLVAAGLAAELVTRRAAKGVPPGHRETKPVFHLLTHYQPLGIIVMESHHVLTLGTFERDLTDRREILF